MGLPIKEIPRQLEAEVDEWIWPGDDAVDLEQSDLVQWAKHGGDAGLVVTGKNPTRIRLGPLSDRAFRKVYSHMMREGSTYLDEAFRFGCRAIYGGGVRISKIRIDGVPGLPDDALDMLGECQADLPWGILNRAMLEAMGTEDLPAGDEEGPTSLPVALGMVVLARTFRARRSGS